MLEQYALLKVVKTLVKKPRTYSVRSLADAAKVSPATAMRCSDYLFKRKILLKEVIGKTYQYRLNSIYFLTKEIKKLISLAEISASGLVEELTELYPDVLSASLYGSVASGLDDPRSDIDILIISKRKIKLAPLKAADKLGRELMLLVYTPAEWREKAKEDKVFYDRVILSAIPLFGEKPVML